MSPSVITRTRILKVCALLLGVLLVLALVALWTGPTKIPFGQLARALAGSTTALSDIQWDIVRKVRWPRIVLAMLVGAALGVAGAAYQALLRNPLADPYVLGVSSGAALGAILSLSFAERVAVTTPVAAFVGAAATIAFVYFLGRRGGQLAPYTLLLAGIITASFLSALIIFLMNFLSGRDLRGAAYWLMGDLSNASSAFPLGLWWLFALILLTIGVVYVVAGNLNLLLGGEPEAAQLGVNIRRTKLVVYLAASLATALAVSVSGAIGYVGLLVPHLVRLLFGSDYRLLIPATALTGAVVLLVADTLARTLGELPVGAVTAVVGAPVFIYLLRRGVGTGGGWQ
ncbi:MAG: FecCD family ABC transporter permease [Terriglobia bacterium]